MVRRRWRIPQTMLVPAPWQGSVEHFYHFFLGYFVPLILWQEKSGATEFTVRDCGPMNPWFSLVRPETEITYIAPGAMLQRVLTHKQVMQIFHEWDDPTRFHRASLSRFADVVLARAVAAGPPSSDMRRPRITVMDRRPSPDFYLSGKSENYASGADWRSVPNMAAIAEALQALGDVTLLDAAALTPTEQVLAFSQSDVLVAQHGAGLANMVWQQAGTAVVEIQPPLAPTIDRIFANLAAARRLDHLLVAQPDEHAPIAPAAVVAAVGQALDERGAHIPAPAGRWPLNALRQLPRRW